MMNKFTNKNNKTHSFITMSDKMRTREKGGPCVAMINPLHLSTTLKAKWIHKIINASHLKPTSAWMSLWIYDMITLYDKAHLNYTLNQMLSSRIPIHTNSNSNCDPHVMSNLKAWYKINPAMVVPNLPSYEDIAQLPLWYNPLITHNGKVFKPPKYFKPSKLYFLGQLYNNYVSNAQYSKYPAIHNGRVLNDSEINRKYTNVRSRLNTHRHFWSRLKRAIPREWHHTLSRGNLEYSDNEWFAAQSLPYDDQLPINEWDIYQVQGSNIQYYTVDDNGRLVKQEGMCAPWGAHHAEGHYPDPHMARRVNVVTEEIKDKKSDDDDDDGDSDDSDEDDNGIPLTQHDGSDDDASDSKSESNKSSHYLKGYTLDPHVNKYNLHHRTFHFGIHPVYFKLKSKSYSVAARKYRNSFSDYNPKIERWRAHAHDTNNWNEIISIIHMARALPHVRNFVWRLMTGKLFCADDANNYLIKIQGFRSQSLTLTQITSCHAKCHTCPTHNHTLEHVFWSCVVVKEYWVKVRNLYDNMGHAFPLDQWQDLVESFDIKEVRSVKGIFHQELLWNALYAIWIQYNKVVSLMQESMEGGRSPWQNEGLIEILDEWTSKTFDIYINLLSRCVVLLPSHVQAVEDDYMYRHNTDAGKQGRIARQIELSHKPITKLDSIGDYFIKAYENTWCKNNYFAKVGLQMAAASDGQPKAKIEICFSSQAS